MRAGVLSVITLSLVTRRMPGIIGAQQIFVGLIKYLFLKWNNIEKSPTQLVLKNFVKQRFWPEYRWETGAKVTFTNQICHS